MKNVFINSVLVVFALLVASCGRQPEAKVEVMSFNIRLDHVADSMNNWKYRKDHAAQMIAYRLSTLPILGATVLTRP